MPEAADETAVDEAEIAVETVAVAAVGGGGRGRW